MRSPSARRSSSCRSSLCIIGLALYPGLITTRGQDAVDRSLAAVNPDAQPAPVAAADWKGWTGYGPPTEVTQR